MSIQVNPNAAQTGKIFDDKYQQFEGSMTFVETQFSRNLALDSLDEDVKKMSEQISHVQSIDEAKVALGNTIEIVKKLEEKSQILTQNNKEVQLLLAELEQYIV